MQNPGIPGRISRLTRRHFITADLETGFALLRAATESRTIADRASELRQIEEARHALQNARRLHVGMHEQDAGKFTARIEELERAIEAADQSTGGGIVTVTR